MYISVSDAATKFNISRRRVQFLCEQGRISGANMIDGVWLIPETATKPADRRKKHLDENQMSLFDTQKGSFTIDDICKTLSISKATAKNWIRLGKIVPDMNGQLFSPEYIEKFVADLKSRASIISSATVPNLRVRKAKIPSRNSLISSFILIILPIF